MNDNNLYWLQYLSGVGWAIGSSDLGVASVQASLHLVSRADLRRILGCCRWSFHTRSEETQQGDLKQK